MCVCVCVCVCVCTASCPLVRPYEAVIIGTVGALCTLGWCRVMDKMKLDDPVCAVAVHGASGMWVRHFRYRLTSPPLTL